MSRIPLPFSVGDISSLSSALRKQLGEMDHSPSHLEMLNLLAKAGGYKNFQHFRAESAAAEPLQAPQPAPAEVEPKLVKRLARFFDSESRLIRWPKKFSERMACLWVMWSRIPANTALTEREISELLDKEHLFGDYALLRRELVDRGLATRTADGREYRRLERRPSPEALALLEHLRISLR